MLVCVCVSVSVCVCGLCPELQKSLWKTRVVTEYMCLCQRDGGVGCYSDLMNPSAFKGHSFSCMQAGAKKQQPGSRSRGLGGGGGSVFPKQTTKWISAEINSFSKRGLRMTAVQLRAQQSCSLLCSALQGLRNCWERIGTQDSMSQSIWSETEAATDALTSWYHWHPRQLMKNGLRRKGRVNEGEGDWHCGSSHYDTASTVKVEFRSPLVAEEGRSSRTKVVLVHTLLHMSYTI